MEKEYKLASELLTLLDSEQRWFTLAEIEEQLGISDKTIRKMIEEISEDLPQMMWIEISRGKGVYLHYEQKSEPMSEVIARLFR